MKGGVPMRLFARWPLATAFLLLVCTGSGWAGIEVLSEDSKQLKVVITEDMVHSELEADSLRAAGQFDAAIGVYQGLIDQCQTDQRLSPETRQGLRLYYTRKIALCYRAKGDYQKALEGYRSILGEGEQMGSEELVLSALLGMGRLALAFGRVDGVAEGFESRKGDLPDEFLVLLGDIYRKAGREGQARQTYLDVLESHLGPSQQGRVILGCYGVPPEQRERLEQKALEEAADLASGLEKLAEEGDSQAQLLLAELAWEQEDYGRALAEFQKAEELAPHDPMIGLQVARSFIALEDNQQALSRLNQIGSLLKGPGELLELATAYQLAGDSGAAAEVLRRLRAEHPDSPEAGEAYLRLKLMERLGL